MTLVISQYKGERFLPICFLQNTELTRRKQESSHRKRKAEDQQQVARDAVFDGTI
jgi:hypothetical protein